jgi:hypothetical protein
LLQSSRLLCFWWKIRGNPRTKAKDGKSGGLKKQGVENLEQCKKVKRKKGTRQQKTCEKFSRSIDGSKTQV